MEELVGKEMYGFKFEEGKGKPSFSRSMKKFIGLKSKIVHTTDSLVEVVFPNDKYRLHWQYPLPEALDHLVEKEEEYSSVEEIIIKMKELNSKL